MEAWARKRIAEVEADSDATASQSKRARSEDVIPPFGGLDLDILPSSDKLYQSVVHGIHDGKKMHPPPPPSSSAYGRGKKRYPPYFGKIDPAYDHYENVLQCAGVLIAEDATASPQWLRARGLPEDKIWKRFYAVSLETYHRKLLLAAPLDRRCFYEVLYKGSPCHAYADVEIYPATNPRMQTMTQFNEFMEIYLGVFEKWLAEYLNVEVKRYTLDSSGYHPHEEGEEPRPRKFSRHYKWMLSYGSCQYAMFTDNTHVGALMQRFECHLIKTYGSPTRPDNIFYFWKEKIKSNPPDPFNDKTQPFDLGVYTLNRMYRLFDNEKLFSRRILTIYTKPGDERTAYAPNKATKFSDVVDYSLLCPPEESRKHPMHILTITQPNGAAAASINIYAHRAALHPHYVSSHANGTSINDTHLVHVGNFFTIADHDDDANTVPGGRVLCPGTKWNGRNGQSKKPNFCTKMCSDFCALFSEELATWGRRKNRSVSQLKMDHADFNCDTLELSMTVKYYCHVLHADPVSTVIKHRSNRGIFTINLTDMTYRSRCLDPDHVKQSSVPRRVMRPLIEKYGKRVKAFIAAFNERYGSDPAKELFEFFHQLQLTSV